MTRWIVQLVYFSSSFVFFAMNRLVAFLFILVYSVDSIKVKSSDSLAPYAIKGIIDQFAAGNNREIEIINFEEKNGEGEKILERVFKLENFSITIETLKTTGKNFELFGRFLAINSIFVFDSIENFIQSIEYFFVYSEIPDLPHFFIYVPGQTIQTIEPFLTAAIHTRISALVHESPQSIELTTPFFLTPEACRKLQWKIVNRFSKTRMRWENSVFFVDKVRNWHKCPMMLQYYEGKYETELFSIFANHLNFTPVKTNETHIDFRRFLFSLSRGVTSAVKGNFYRMKFMHFEQSKIFIPPGELYGDYEKMLLPFDNLTWIGIVLTIFGGVVVIVVIKWLSPSNQELYFGRNNRSPIMNFISIILNGNQNDSLAENLPRMLLMLFIVWCLIFR
jgi:hypothetical protein